MENHHGARILFAISFATQLGFMIALPIGIFMLLGAWIDRRLATGPLFVMLGVLAGSWTSWYEVRRLLKTLTDEDHADAEHHS